MSYISAKIEAVKHLHAVFSAMGGTADCGGYFIDVTDIAYFILGDFLNHGPNSRAKEENTANTSLTSICWQTVSVTDSFLELCKLDGRMT